MCVCACAHQPCQQRPIILIKLSLDGPGASWGGGAARSIESGRLTVDNSRLEGNKAGSAGGAIAGMDFAAVTLRSSQLSGNSAAGGGGGLAVLQVRIDDFLQNRYG